MSVPAKQTNPASAFAAAGALIPASVPNAGMVKTGGDGTIPFIGFYNNKMKRGDEVKADIPTLKEADAFIRTAAEGYKKLDPLIFSVVEMKQLWVERDDGNNAVAATVKEQDFKSKLKEEIQAIVLVYNGDTITPALASFRTGLAPLGSVANTGINKASDNDKWAAQSPEHRLTLAIPSPQLRFTVTANTFMKAFNTGRKGAVGKGRISPLTGAQMVLLGGALADPAFGEQLKNIRNVYKKRVEELTALVKD